MVRFENPKSPDTFAAHALGVLSEQFQPKAGHLDHEAGTTWNFQVDVAIGTVASMFPRPNTHTLSQLFIEPESVREHRITFLDSFYG